MATLDEYKRGDAKRDGQRCGTECNCKLLSTKLAASANALWPPGGANEHTSGQVTRNTGVLVQKRNMERGGDSVLCPFLHS